MENFGFIRDKIEIKMLILFVLKRLSAPVDLPTLGDLVMCDGAISYFDFAECVSELTSTGNVIESEGKLSISDVGRSNIDVTETSLPYSVRVTAQRRAEAYANEQKRDSLITTYHEYKNRTGYTVTLALSDGISQIIKLELLAGSESQALVLEDNFRKNAEAVYGKVMEYLLDNQ